MKSLYFFIFTGLWSTARAFPHLSPLAARDFDLSSGSESQIKARQASLSETNCGPIPCLIFDEVEQFVDVSPGSAHQYVAPGSGDIRGPCPGLNAAANHGFISHDGVPDITQCTYCLKIIIALAELITSN
jgi:hypothetical protein